MSAGKLVERRTGFGLKAEDSGPFIHKRYGARTVLGLFGCALALLFASGLSRAQLAPTGGHYAARATDTGFAGLVNSSGGYAASVPLDLPAARGGLPIPVQIVYGGNRVGAAGLGWDVPLSYIFRDTTIAHRRPIGGADSNPRPREQLILVLDGAQLVLVRNVANTAWVVQRNGQQLEVREAGDGAMVMVDGEGRRYGFSAQAGSAGSRLISGKLFLLVRIDGSDGNVTQLGYSFGAPSLPSGGTALSISLKNIVYNVNPSNAECFKNRIVLNYGPEASAPLSISMLGGTALARTQTLLSVIVHSRAACSGSVDIPLRVYNFGYEPDVDMQLPRLKSVVMTGQADTPEQSIALPVATYSYGSATRKTQKLTYRKTRTVALPADIDGFGIGSTFLDAAKPGFDPRYLKAFVTWQGLSDVTGDGRPDVLLKKEGQLFAARNIATTSGMQFGGPRQITGGPNEPAPDPMELSYLQKVRAPSDPSGQFTFNTDTVWRQSIDVNGDGRLDILDATEGDGIWVAYLNTPDVTDPAEIHWERRVIPVTRLLERLIEGGHDLGLRLPLARRKTGAHVRRNRCFRFVSLPAPGQWVEDSRGFQNGGCTGTFDQITFVGPEVTHTEWELMDINGDGYPDFVLNSAPIESVSVGGFSAPVEDPVLPPSNPRNDQFANGRQDDNLRFQGGSSNRVDVMLNVAGVHLGDVNLFSAPVFAWPEPECAVETWTVGELTCGFADVNGDGIPDRVRAVPFGAVTAYLGTGQLGSFYSTSATITLPGPLAQFNNTRASTCTSPATPDSTPYEASQLSGLRDLNSDGLPDYIRRNGSQWTASLGTGVGFQAPIPVDTGTGSFALSEEVENCGGTRSDTLKGLYDLDGDGRAELVMLNGTIINGRLHGDRLDVYQLNGESDAAPVSEPNEGRLIEVGNGYGASTSILYASAKDEGLTPHQVPFPEIVVASVSTNRVSGDNLLTPTQYAYGGAYLIFDPAFDRFVFPGYQRTVEMRITSDQVIPPPTEGVAKVVDHYRLAPFNPDDPAMTVVGRLGRYLKVGQIENVATLSGNIGSNPAVLLPVDTAVDARLVGMTHYDFDARLLPSLTPEGTPRFFECLDMVYPYDWAKTDEYHTRFAPDLSIDQCAARGFVFQTVIDSYRTNPGSPVVELNNVHLHSEVAQVDDFGRVLQLKQFNDVNNNPSDDLLVTTTYAEPTGSNARVLNAIASRKITNFAGTKTYASDSYEYNTSGFVTAHVASRIEVDTARLLDTIRVFDAVYDSAGNPTTVTKTRDPDASGNRATQTVTTEYDVFGLAPTSTDVAAADVTLHTLINRDPLTLNVLNVKDENGTERGNTFDGFGRLLTTTVKPAGGDAAGIVSSRKYLGFGKLEVTGRQIVETIFTDPVADPAKATGRTRTSFFDALGRRQSTEEQLGADYSNQKLVVDFRQFDRLGRVIFEADPRLSGESVNTAYGTSYYYNIDGTPDCFIRGRGHQLNTNVTNEEAERYPTCFEHFFSAGAEHVTTQDAASLLPGSPQFGVVHHSVVGSRGLLLSRFTTKPGANGTAQQIELVDYGYDVLGHMSQMTRYANPGPGTGPVKTTWKYDSLGQVLELTNPGAQPQLYSYDHWGEMTGFQWTDSTNSTLHRLLSEYDGFGRITRQTDPADPDAELRYRYDSGVKFSDRVTPTFLKGRLAQATWSTGQVALSYDGLGNTQSRQFADPAGKPVAIEKYAYHADGSLSQLDLLLSDTGFASESVNYVYDSAGRTRSVQYASDTSRQTLFDASGTSALDSFGRVRQALYGATTFNASYAEEGRRMINSVKIASPAPSSASREIAFAPAFDPMGRERARREIRNGTETTAIESAYDSLGRLQASATQQFQQDSLGNLLSFTTAGATGVLMSYDTSDRDRVCRITFAGSAPGSACNVKYDGVGNIIEEPTRSNGLRTLTYFTNGRTKRVTDGAGNDANFHYDAFGRVAQLDVTSNTSADTRHDRHYGSLVTQREIGVAGAKKTVLTRSIPLPGMVATRQGPESSNAWTFAFGDGRGNRFFTDQAGLFVQDVNYSAYGEPTSSGAQPGSETYSSQQWNGRDALAAVGLSQLGARLYDPVIGRFLSRDPLIIPRTATTTNPYAFANNDPVNSSDPSGYCSPGEECHPDGPVCLGFICIGNGGDHGGSSRPPSTPRPDPDTPLDIAPSSGSGANGFPLTPLNPPKLSTRHHSGLTWEQQEAMYRGMTRAAMTDPSLRFVFAGPGGATIDRTFGIQAEATLSLGAFTQVLGVNVQCFEGEGCKAYDELPVVGSGVGIATGVAISGNVGVKITSFNQWMATNFPDQWWEHNNKAENPQRFDGSKAWEGIFHQVGIGADVAGVGFYYSDDVTGWWGVSLGFGPSPIPVSFSTADVEYVKKSW